MEDQHQSKTVNNDGVTLPGHDFAGLSQVISNAKPTLPGTENGFVPLNSLDLTKHFEAWKEYLKDWQERLDKSRLQPDQIIDELKEAKKKLVDKHENDFEQRIRDLENGYRDRMGEWREHHRDFRELYTQWGDDWKNRYLSMEMKRDSLVEDRVNDLINNYNIRLSELGKFHEELKNELNKRIEDLEIREKELKNEKADLEQKREQHLDERREWLREREEKFDVEKMREGKVLVKLRKQIVKNEYDIEKTPIQILMDKFWYTLFGIILVGIIAVTIVYVGCHKYWGQYPPPNCPPPTHPTSQFKIDPVKITMEITPTT